jgi:Uma2 family endonuclease
MPKTHSRHASAQGPFRVESLRPGDPYELSNGHAIASLPTGGRGGKSNLVGAAVLDSDPAVQSAGVDTGFTPEPGTMRAPDIAVGNVPDRPGWVPGVPPLAVEYSDIGQDEEKLKEKIRDLLDAGTQYIWVVRLHGPRRVEVYTPHAKMRVVRPGSELTAPGVLQNPVPVTALYDREIAHEVTLRNLLQRKGFDSLEAVQQRGREEGRERGREEGRERGREEGRERGREEGWERGREEGLELGREEGALEQARESLRQVLKLRKLAPTPTQNSRIAKCTSLPKLAQWLKRAITATTAREVFAERKSAESTPVPTARNKRKSRSTGR